MYFRYLRDLKKYREEGWQIVYTDETWVNQNHSHQGGWTENKASSMTALSPSCTECSRYVPSGKGPRLIILDAGSGELGFIPGAGIIFESKTNSADYHDEMNTTHYLEWFEDKLLRNLGNTPSVVVLDNAPYHNARTAESRNPTTSWRKEDIQAWLTKNKITFEASMLKAELLEIAGRHRLDPVYETDVLAKAQGHRVLRLPVRHCELNPIELIQAQLKGYVARNNNTFKLADVKKLVLQAKETITREDWAKAVDHVRHDAEAHFTRVDCLDRPELERIVISGIDSDDDFDPEDKFDGDSSSDEEEDDLLDLGEAPSSMLDLPGTAQQSSAALAMPGDPLDAMDVEGDDDEVCGCCGRRDLSNTAGGDTEWVQCDACSLWYHQLCEKAPPGGFTDYFICKSCRSKFCVSFI